jgi:hypothetical protein
MMPIRNVVEAGFPLPQASVAIAPQRTQVVAEESRVTRTSGAYHQRGHAPSGDWLIR